MKTLTNFSISGTKCDRDKTIFSAEEGEIQIVIRHKIVTQSDQNFQKQGSSPWNLPTMPMYGSTLPRTKITL